MFTGRINGLEMHPIFKNQFVTACGQDCRVKLHTLKSSGKTEETVLSTSVPIWKASYTPFGDGLATVVVPQLKDKNVNTLFLWHNADLGTPVHSFFGHKDVVLDFGEQLFRVESRFQPVQ